MLHELAHVLRHLSRERPLFVDDLDGAAKDPAEREADAIAAEALLPRGVWRRSTASRRPSREAVLELSASLSVHPGIVAGRIRRETGNYAAFSEFLGQGEVSRVLAR